MRQLRRAIILTSVLALCASAVILKKTRAADDLPRLDVAPARPSSIEGRPTGSSRAAASVPAVAVARTAVLNDPSVTAPQAKGPGVTNSGVTNPAVSNPAITNPGASKAPPPGAPQVPEESATIRDDPTIAPDPKQSADNNVSFPSDI